jgi:hypothetical protein
MMGFSRDSRWMLTTSDGTSAELSCAQLWDARHRRPVGPPLRPTNPP